MSGAQNRSSVARYKLIKTFFWIIRAAGMEEENAREVVRGLYNTDSLKELTVDELKRVVDELIAITKIEVRKPIPKRAKIPAENLVVTRSGRVIQLPTREQLAMIEYLADKMRMAQGTLQHLIKKAGGDPTLSAMSARTLIEILKAMHSRGWKGKPVDEPEPRPGKDN